MHSGIILLAELAAVFSFAFAVNFPMTGKPLSEDEGNWFYLAVFSDKKLKLHRDVWMPGYFNLSWFAAVFHRLFGKRRGLAFFQWFKVIWYSLTAASVSLAVFAMFGSHVGAVAAGIMFAVATATQSTLFMLTYAEHFNMLFMNLALAAVFHGLQTGQGILFAAAGVSAGLVIQFKPTGLLFSLLLPFSFLAGDEFLTTNLNYWAPLLLVQIIPAIILRFHAGRVDSYVQSTFTANFRDGLHMALKILRLDGWAHRAGILPPVTHYVGNNAIKSGKSEFSVFKANMLPPAKDLRLLLVLASAYVIWSFGAPSVGAIVAVGLFGLALVVQQLQKNYYTPHFNQIWAPIAMLAGMCVSDVGSGLADWRTAAVLGLVIVGVEGFRLGRMIKANFSPEARRQFGHISPMVARIFDQAGDIGEYIRANSKESDRLFVWGDQPSIYLYARRRAADPRFFFVYGHYGGVRKEKSILEQLYRNPPELILFHNWKVADDWNMKLLEESIGFSYTLVSSFPLADSHGRPVRNNKGEVVSFPLYRRNDEKAFYAFLERAAMSERAGESSAASAWLDKALEIRPEAKEVELRREFLGREKTGAVRELARRIDHAVDEEERRAAEKLRAELLLDTEAPEKSIERFARIACEEASDHRIFSLLGEAHYRAGDKAEAFKHLTRALKLFPLSPEALNNLGVFFMERNRFQEAMEFFTKASTLTPPELAGKAEADRNLAMLRGAARGAGGRRAA